MIHMSVTHGILGDNDTADIPFAIQAKQGQQLEMPAFVQG